MKKGSTLFLKAVIYFIGAAVLATCLAALYTAFTNDRVGMYLPILLMMNVTAIPFFYALYQGLLLLRYIDLNTAFSELSVGAIKNIRYCALIVSALYAVSMPYIYHVAEKDDAPGVIVIAFVIMSAFFATGVFAAVLQRLLQNAIEIKSENDLTV